MRSAPSPLVGETRYVLRVFTIGALSANASSTSLTNFFYCFRLIVLIARTMSEIHKPIVVVVAFLMRRIINYEFRF